MPFHNVSASDLLHRLPYVPVLTLLGLSVSLVFY